MFSNLKVDKSKNVIFFILFAFWLNFELRYD